ncbi:MAG: hypothetical protein WAU88_10745 [Candidatus Zixiibacteriota bacterium]
MNDSVKDNLPTNTVQESLENEGEVLEWVSHPLKRSLAKSAGVSAVILLFAILVWTGTDSIFFTSLSIVVLVMALTKFFLPTGYKLTEQKIYVKSFTHTLVKEWKIYRSYYPDKNGILLSTFAGPSRLENFRGLYLLFEGNRDQVIAYVKARLASPETPVAESSDLT